MGSLGGVLISFINSTQPRTTWEEGFNEELPVLHWPVGVSVGDGLAVDWCENPLWEVPFPKQTHA